MVRVGRRKRERKVRGGRERGGRRDDDIMLEEAEGGSGTVEAMGRGRLGTAARHFVSVG